MVSFGTSGVRGLVQDLGDDICFAYSATFVKLMREHGHLKGIAVAMDLRPSSPAIAKACGAAVQAAGVPVINLGELPTPALANFCREEGIPGIMVTGSHIPFDRNGIKFYTRTGEITKGDEDYITASLSLPSTFAMTELPTVNTAAGTRYIQRYARFFSGRPLSGKKIGLYEHSSVSRDLLKTILSMLGAEVISFGRSDSFIPIDTEAITENQKILGKQWAAEHSVFSLVSTDGDGDRPLISDETGNWIRGDIVGLLTSIELGIEQLAIPVSCNTAVERSNCFRRVIRTRIGSPFVIAAIESELDGRTAGFEANGGFLLGSDLSNDEATLYGLPTRDAVLPIIAVLVAASRRDIPVSALLSNLPQTFTSSDRLQNVPRDLSQKFLEGLIAAPEHFLTKLNQLDVCMSEVSTLDGVRIRLSTEEFIHFRASGNAPELRCYSESGTYDRADKLVRDALEVAFKEINRCSTEQISCV